MVTVNVNVETYLFANHSLYFSNLAEERGDVIPTRLNPKFLACILSSSAICFNFSGALIWYRNGSY